MIVDESWSKPRDHTMPRWLSLEYRDPGGTAGGPLGWIAVGLTLVAGTFFQSVIPTAPWLAQARVPCLLAVVIYYALQRGLGAALTTAVLAGLFQDALTPIPLGYSSACFAVIALLMRRSLRVMDPESLVGPAFLSAVSAFCVTLALYALLARAGLVSYPFGRLCWKAAAAGLLALPVTPVVFLVNRRLDRFLGIVATREDANGLH